MILSLTFCVLLVSVIAGTFSQVHAEQHNGITDTKDRNYLTTLVVQVIPGQGLQNQFPYHPYYARKRKKRGVLGAAHVVSYAAYRAWRYLLAGSKRVSQHYAFPGEYQKPGNYKTAVEEFLYLNPKNVKEVELPDGVSRMTGQVGDRHFVIKSTKKGEKGKAILTMFRDKATMQQRSFDKIVYMGNRKIIPTRPGW